MRKVKLEICKTIQHAPNEDVYIQSIQVSGIVEKRFRR
jgi:hypothetical protein